MNQACSSHKEKRALLTIDEEHNLLETAFRAMQAELPAPSTPKDDAVEIYAKLFRPLPGAQERKPFKLFSRTDPTIRVFMAATTNELP